MTITKKILIPLIALWLLTGCVGGIRQIGQTSDSPPDSSQEGIPEGTAGPADAAGISPLVIRGQIVAPTAP